MKPPRQPPPADLSQALAKFEELPEETKRLLKLKQEAEKAAGETGRRLEKKIRQHARKPLGS